MGQLERYGLYVLVVVIFLILGVAIMGGDPGSSGAGSSRGEVASGELVIADGGGTRAPGPDDFKDVRTSERLGKFFDGTDDAGPFVTPPAPDRKPGSNPLQPVVRTENERTQTPPAPPPGPVQPTIYEVRSGDSFFKIAATVYGDASKSSLIAAANPTADPRRLQPGQKLVIPSIDRAEARVDAVRGDVVQVVDADGTKIHVVKDNEIMGTIAKLYYGSVQQWHRIADANPEVRPESMPAGTRLRIPPAN